LFGDCLRQQARARQSHGAGSHSKQIFFFEIFIKKTFYLNLKTFYNNLQSMEMNSKKDDQF
jgi:hypothetical protein